LGLKIQAAAIKFKELEKPIEDELDLKTQEIVNKFNGKALNFVVVLKDIAKVNETKSGLNIGTEVDKNEKYKKQL